MSVSTAKRLPSLIRPMAMPATCAFIGTPASISDEAAAADRSHRRGAVGLGDFRHHAHRCTGTLPWSGSTATQRALGQAAVADFAALRAAHAAGFAGGERRHVVVQHEAVVRTRRTARRCVCASRSVPSVATTSACVSPRVNSAEPWVRGSTLLRISIGAHGAGVAAVDARLAGQDLAAHDLGFDVEQHACQRPRRRTRRRRRLSAAITSAGHFTRQACVRACLARIW